MEYYERYKAFVRQNASILSIFETGASSLTWLLPDRFNEQELTLEAIHTAINLLSAFHDGIINEPGLGAPAGSAELSFALAALQQMEVLVELWAIWAAQKRTISNRYDPLLAMEGLKSLVRLAIFYRSQTRILTNGGATAFDKFLLSTTTTSDAKPAEVYAAFSAFRQKHCFIDAANQSSTTTTTTSARALLQTATRRAANNFLSIGNKLRSGVGGGGGGSNTKQSSSLTTHISSPVTGAVNGVKQEEQNLDNNTNDKDAFNSNNANQTNTYWWELPPKSPNELLLNTTTPDEDPLQTTTKTTLSQSVDALRSLELWAASRQTAAAKILITAEILHILRPVLYVMALQRWGRRSWKSWSVSLLVELASIRLNAAGAAGSQAAAAAAAEHPAVKGTSLALLYGLQGVRWTREEADELTRRKLLLLYYLARDPFFSRYTRPAVEKWTRTLRWIPLAGWIGDKAAEVLFGAQRYYTYTAAS